MSLIAQKLISASGGVQEETDDDFNLVTGLFHFDGSNGAQNKTFLDSSSNSFSVTRAGSSTQGTFSPFCAEDGKWSVEFDESDDYLEVASSSDFDYTSSLCVDGWFFMTDDPGTAQNAHAIVTRWAATSGDRAFLIDVESTGLRVLVNQGGSTNVTVCDPGSSGAVSLNEWHHFALTWDGTTYRAFLDGGLEGSVTGNAAPTGNGRVVRIGYNTNTHYFGGYISNVRIVVDGGAIYTSAFTPPTSPSTAISGTQLLTSCSNRFKDKSTSARSITTNSSPRIRPFSPFAPSYSYSAATNGGSFYGDGSGDYASIAASSDFDVLSDGTFTIDFWFYRINALGTYADYVGIFNGVSAGVLIYQNGSTFDVYINGSTIFNVTHPNLREWIHVALTRDGTTLRLFLNGVASGTSTASLGTSNYPLNVAGDSTGRVGIKGYVSDVRVVKGTAVYTSAFTPPTAPSTAITNTEALLSFTNAAIFDQTGKTNVITRANAQLDTSVKKFGTASLELDGTNDYLEITAGSFISFGEGDFTIEFFFNSDSFTGYKAFLASANYYNATGSWLLRATSATSIAWASYNASGANEAYKEFTVPSMSTGTWYHLAAVRSSGSINIYLNGTVSSSGALSDSKNLIDGFVNGVYVGSEQTFSANQDFDGYIDELRITKKARYTSNFTAPTKEFPNL